MKTINEATTLSALGATRQDIRAVHKGDINVPHDTEYVPIKTKTEATAYLKQGHLIVCKTADGQFGSITMQERSKMFSFQHETNYRITYNGESTIVTSLRDALAKFTGRGRLFYRSVKPLDVRYGYEPGQEWADDIQHIDEVMNKVERLYGDKLKAEARAHANEIKKAIASAVTKDKRENTSVYYSEVANSLGRLKQGYDALYSIAKSKTPFNALAKSGCNFNFRNVVGKAVSSDRNDFGAAYHVPGAAGQWAKKTPAATAKIARFALSKVRQLRDDAFRGYYVDKEPVEAEPFTLMVREAYKRYIKEQSKSGDTNRIKGDEGSYEKAMNNYAKRHASNYLNGGDESAYGVNKFDHKAFGVTKKQAASDYKKAYKQYTETGIVRSRSKDKS